VPQFSVGLGGDEGDDQSRRRHQHDGEDGRDEPPEVKRAAGVLIEGEPRSEAYGSVVVFLDPFGNRWDLLGLPPRE